MIKTTNLFYNYDSKFSALYDVNLNLDSNTIILADELSSKTLFRIISGQYKDYKGEIIIDNKNLKEIRQKDLSLCYITNPPYLINKKSIEYNIAYPLLVRKQNKTNALKQAQELMARYNLTNKKIKECTNFEKLNISLLRALIRHPQIILIDDIFTNLNNKEFNQVLNILNELNSNSLVIISLNDDKILKKFDHYKIIKLFNGSIEK